MFAITVINIEAPLAGTFHYHVPADLRPKLDVGHLVEVEFGRRLAQAIVIGFSQEAPVEETKPVIALIDSEPVVRSWQIDLALWLSEQYLTPLNACLRLMLPPGLTRWSDVTYDLNPYWDGKGRLTEVQEALIQLLSERGDLRGRQIARAMSKGVDWRSAASQLVRRDILRRASVLDPPRVRPKVIRTAELSSSPARFPEAVMSLGRKTLTAEVLYYLLQSDDPLPTEETVLQASGAKNQHLAKLAAAGIVRRTADDDVILPLVSLDDVPAEFRELYLRLPAQSATLPDDQAVQALAKNKLIERLKQPATISLAVSTEETIKHLFAYRGGDKYYQVLQLLTKAAVPVAISEIYSATGTTINHLRKLRKLDLIRFGQEEVWRDPLADRDFVPADPPRLTSDQLLVWQQIEEKMLAQSEDITENDSGSVLPYLLHGVTGSGKTEIYLRAVDLALKQNRQAIALVPEIALTPQTVRRFAARFPGQVAVLHSRLTEGERYDTWRRVREGRVNIVVGPRSALFSPFERLGVIVVDEEHDHSYKQTPPVPPPYYHAREVAVELGRLTRSITILGSATPDVVTYHQAQAGRYTLLELPRRIMGHRQRIEDQSARFQRPSHYEQAESELEEALTIPLPPVQIVDLRQELRAGNRSIFSRPLQKALDNTLERGEQAILFLNRRGTSSFIICRDCGLVLACPRCDSPLTYHRPGAMLVCHTCGRQEPPHETCPRCGSHRIKYFGLGTEEVQRRVQLQWPDARTVRWDRDTTAGRDSHESLLASFINQEADILVGTQMIAKGLDLPLVTLVGVISADVSLGLPDFGIGERTFQVLAQVAGRAGRGLLGGRVIVQTYQPEHYAIRSAAEHDFTTFYLDEIRFRTQHSLPPFRRMARLIIADPISDRAEQQAHELARTLRIEAREKALRATELYGPVPPFFQRVDGRYRWQIIIRSPNPVRLLSDVTIPTGWVVDIDPVSTL